MQHADAVINQFLSDTVGDGGAGVETYLVRQAARAYNAHVHILIRVASVTSKTGVHTWNTLKDSCVREPRAQLDLIRSELAGRVSQPYEMPDITHMVSSWATNMV